MRFTLGDLFFGVINLFVLVIPGAFVLIGWALLFDLPPWLHREAAVLPRDSAGGILLLAASCYFVGHLVSLGGQYLDTILQEQGFRESPHLRPLARSIVAATFPSEVIQDKDVRRWSEVILRQAKDATYENVLQKNADRRFFRNMVVVFLLWIAMLISRQTRFPRLPADDFRLTVLLLAIALLCFARYRDQDRKFTRDVFESLIAAHPIGRVEHLESAELRWFLEIAPDDSACRVWRANDGYTDEGCRTDYYVRGTGPALGIKLREGRIEIKRRIDPSEGISLAEPKQNLTTETWSKSTFTTSDTLAPVRVEERVWLAIEKRRTSKKFSWDTAESRLKRLAASDRVVGPGCQAEITILRIGAETKSLWWTLGFEAFGPARDRTKALEQTLITVLGTLPERVREKILGQAPQSYPEWIDQGYGTRSTKTV